MILRKFYVLVKFQDICISCYSPPPITPTLVAITYPLTVLATLHSHFPPPISPSYFPLLFPSPIPPLLFSPPILPSDPPPPLMFSCSLPFQHPQDSVQLPASEVRACKFGFSYNDCVVSARTLNTMFCPRHGEIDLQYLAPDTVS